MAYTIDSTLGDLIADPKVRPTLDQYFPGVSNHPQVAMVKGFTLRMIISNPMAAQFGITQAQADLFLKEVNKVAG